MKRYSGYEIAGILVALVFVAAFVILVDRQNQIAELTIANTNNISKITKLLEQITYNRPTAAR